MENLQLPPSKLSGNNYKEELMKKMEELICFGMIGTREYEEISKEYFSLLNTKK